MIRIPLCRSFRARCSPHCRCSGLLPRIAQTLPSTASARRTPQPMQISWEVRNRFRLFREERDFKLHTESAQAGNILASEDVLEQQSDGRGWARNIVNRLCIDLTGRVSEPCTRDNVKESYLTPVGPSGHGSSHRPGSGRRDLRLVVRRRRRPLGNRRSIAPSRSICGSATAAPPTSPSMSPAPMRRSGSPPRSRCATSSSPALATASHPAKAIRTGRSR